MPKPAAPGMWVMLACLFLFAPATALAQTYFTDSFAEPPTQWQTDLGDRVQHQAASGTVTLTLPTRFIDGNYAKRYFLHDLGGIDPSQDFTLEWRQKVTAVDTGGFVQFGLFDDSFLFQDFLGRLVPTSTVSAGMWRARNGSSGYRFNVQVKNTSNGQGGSAVTFPFNTWYQGRINYHAASNTVTATLTNEETDEDFLAFTKSVPGTFSTDMQYVGISLHPEGKREVFGDDRYDTGSMDVVLDDVSFQQGPPLPPEPTGASSVLFLPGIQASRLYTTDDGPLQQRWTPLSTGDFTALAMDENGQSINEVFTNDVVDEVLPLGTVYGNFLDYLESLKAANTIADYNAFAYDWRYSVVDVVANGTEYFDGTQYIDEQLESLAAESQTGKVTIVAHSNGGLLAKALLKKLETQDRLDLVDDFIMVGTPQLGTPKAITSLLHGLGQGISYKNWLTIVSEETARDVAVTTPGAYGLLPGATYAEGVDEPFVEFAAGTATQPFIEVYGNEISNAQELDDFLLDTANVRENAETAAQAAELNQTLLTNARAEQAQLINWTPPDAIDTYSLVGIGRNTIRGIRYESFRERDCMLLFACTERDIYKPVPLFSTNGDATVMAPSAVSFDTDITNYFVNIEEFSQPQTDNEFFHYNFTEAPTVQQLIGNLIQASSTKLDFVSTSTPTVNEPDQVLLGAHSPVYFYIADASGRRTGQIDETTVREDIPGTEFLLLGDSRYVIVPKTIDTTIHLVGYGQGSATFSVSDLARENQPMIHKVPIEKITASTTIVADFTSAQLQNLEIDQDGDGTRDYQLTPSGERINDQPTEVTYSVLLAYMDDNLDPYVVRVISGLPRLAEHFSHKQYHSYFQFIEYRLLNKFRHLLTQLHEHSFISEQHRNVLLNYVTKLQAKINL